VAGSQAERLESLQRSVGNAQFARLVTARASAQQLQGTWLNPFHTAPVDDESLSDAERIERTAHSSGNDVVALYHYQDGRLVSLATDDQRIAMLQLLHSEHWVGPVAEYAMEFIWNSFGERIAAVGAANEALWTGCIDDGAELHDLSSLASVRAAFRTDVKAIADQHMAVNLQATHTEQERLGLRDPEGAPSPTRDLEIELHRQQVADLMNRAAQAQAAMAALRGLRVGYDMVIAPHSDMPRELPVMFDPERQPPYAPHGGERPPFHDYDDVHRRWEAVQAYLDITSAQSPAVFAAVAQDRVTDANQPTPAQALQVVGQVLQQLESNIADTRENVASDDIDYRSLSPIHSQLYSGQVQAPSGTPWNTVVARSVGEGIVADEEAWHMWQSLIVGLLAAGAFVAAEFFSGGLATPFLIGIGAGLSVGQAGVSWIRYAELATASQSAASAETRVVSPEQAEAAAWQAVLDTVFAFLDVASPAWQAVRAIRLESAVARTMAETAVGRVSEVAGLLASGDRAQAAQLVRAAVNEFGVQGAIQRTGKSAEELAALFEGDAQMQGRLLGATRYGVGAAGARTAEQEAAAEAARRTARAALAAEGTPARAFLESGPLETLLPEVRRQLSEDVITREMADQLVLEGIERFGPASTMRMAGGWRPLAAVLTNESRAAAPFLAWRDAIFQDMKEFSRRVLREEIPEQGGSAGMLSNDLDISFMGEHGAEHRVQMQAFVAARAGIDDSPHALMEHLYMELFTDPRRLAAYDALPNAVREEVARRQTAYERELIPNRDLFQARQAHDAELEQAILEDMRRDGVSEIAYHPLSSGEIERLARDLDGVHAELLAAVQRGDVAAQVAAAERLGQTQALMNAAEEGGYFSGGSARRYVTQRPGSTIQPLVPGRGLAALSTDAVGAMLDQISKLSHAFAELNAANLRADVVEALRAIGKYGERARTIALGPAFDAEAWDGLREACRGLKAAADSGGGAELLRVAPDLTETMARRLFDGVREDSMQALERIRAAAGDLGPGNAEQIIEAIQHHVAMLRALDYMQYLIGAMARAVRTGTQLLPGELEPPPSLGGDVGDFGSPTEGRGQPAASAPATVA
jgi:hypothetical protein